MLKIELRFILYQSCCYAYAYYLLAYPDCLYGTHGKMGNFVGRNVPILITFAQISCAGLIIVFISR